MKKQSKGFKLALTIIISLFIITAAAAALFFYFYPKDKLLGILTSEAEQSLKRKIIVKDINYDFRGIILKDIIIFDGETQEYPILASAEDARISFSIFSLFYRRLSISDIAIDNLKINIIYSDGTSNIERLLNDLKSKEKTPLTAEIYQITLTNAQITLGKAPDILKPLSGKYILNCTVDLSGEDKFMLSDSKIILPEKRGVIFTDLVISINRSNFKITGDVRLDKCSFPWTFKWGDSIQLPFNSYTGKIKKLKITKNIVQGYVKGSSLLKGSKTAFVNGFCRVDIPGKTVYLSNTKGSTQKSNLLINELIFTFKGAIRKFNISDMNINLAELNSFLTSIPRELYGTISGNLKSINNVYNGNLKLNGVGYNRDFISEINTVINISNNVFKKENLPILIYKQPFSLSMASTDGNFKRFFLNLNSDKFVFKQDKDKNGLPHLNVNIPIEVSGRIAIKYLHFDNLSISGISLNYSFKQNNLSINRFKFGFFGGNVKGKGNMDLSQKNPYIVLAVQFREIKVQNLSNISERFKNRAFGIADGEADIKFTLEKDFSIYKSLRGGIEFSVDKGKLANTGIQNGLGVLLSELKYKLKDLEFNKIYGNFKISGDNYFINSFIFTAPDIRLKVDGYLNRRMAGDIKINLKFNRNFIQDLPNPAILSLNQYKKGRWYIIPFQAKGKDITKSENIRRLK